MNKTLSLIRITILLVLSIIAVTCLLGNELTGNPVIWLLLFVVSKTIAIGACLAIARLYRRWSKIDPWFIAYDRMCDEVMDSSNPAKL